MAGSQTAGREHVPEGKVRSSTSLRSDGLRVKCSNEGEILPGSHGDLGESHFTGRCGWKLILGMTEELRRQPSLGYTSEAWL